MVWPTQQVSYPLYCQRLTYAALHNVNGIKCITSLGLRGKLPTLMQGATALQDQMNPIIVLKTSYVIYGKTHYWKTCLMSQFIHSFTSSNLIAILKMQWQKTNAFLVLSCNKVFADTCCLKACSFASAHTVYGNISTYTTHTHTQKMSIHNKIKTLIRLLQIYLEHLLYINTWIFLSIHKNLENNWIKIYIIKRKK